MNGDPILLFHFSFKYMIKFIYKKIQQNPILEKKIDLYPGAPLMICCLGLHILLCSAGCMRSFSEKVRNNQETEVPTLSGRV